MKSVAPALLGGLCLATVWTSPALAHPIVDEGVRHYENADFPRAIQAFARAEAASDLQRADVVELLVRRALVHFAMNAEARMREDLRRLATLEPNHVLGAETPPAVRAAFESVRRDLEGRIALRVESHAIPDGVHLAVEVTGDAAGLVRSVRLGARSPGGEWTEREGNEIDVPAAEVEYYAEAIGPGGAVLASDGSRDAPRTASAGGVVAGGGGGAVIGGDDEGDEGGAPIWLFVGLGAVAVAAAVVAVVLITSAQSDQTQLGAPTVEALWSAVP